MMLAMTRIYDPAALRHPKLRECVYQAAWIATVAEAANDVEDHLVDVPAEDRVLPDYSTPWPWDFESFVTALSVMSHAREAAERSLSALVSDWLAEDPENWPVFRLTLVDPWQERPGDWSEETPEWVRILGAIAHETADPFGRRPAPS
jgi:hypothetical protein